MGDPLTTREIFVYHMIFNQIEGFLWQGVQNDFVFLVDMPIVNIMKKRKINFMFPPRD